MSRPSKNQILLRKCLADKTRHCTFIRSQVYPVITACGARARPPSTSMEIVLQRSHTVTDAEPQIDNIAYTHHVPRTPSAYVEAKPPIHRTSCSSIERHVSFILERRELWIGPKSKLAGKTQMWVKSWGLTVWTLASTGIKLRRAQKRGKSDVQTGGISSAGFPASVFTS